MPLVRIDMFPGRSREMKDALIRNVTRAVIDSVGCPIESVQVILHEVDMADWARGGVSHAQRKTMKT